MLWDLKEFWVNWRCLSNRISFSWRYLEGAMRTQKRCMGFRLERHKRLPGGYGASARFVNDMKSYLVGRYGGTSQKTWNSLRYWRNVKLISVLLQKRHAINCGKQTRENHVPAYKCFCLEMITALIFYWPNRITSHILLQSRPARKEFLKFMVSNNNVHCTILLLIRSFKFRHQH